MKDTLEGWVDGWVGGWMNGRTDKRVCLDSGKKVK